LSFRLSKNPTFVVLRSLATCPTAWQRSKRADGTARIAGPRAEGGGRALSSRTRVALAPTAGEEHPRRQALSEPLLLLVGQWRSSLRRRCSSPALRRGQALGREVLLSKVSEREQCGAEDDRPDDDLL